ncbi:MAG TPA: MFS transporter [Actinophytocola sp.]|jgi:MFS family permease|uniref:MDR family MFS transporter n=1 Tax=Actinophytocola sp. TaxID=1872138 RepID=UPI002E08E017|nr:MFS transporter [Actinophytocola sp.]
MTALLGAESAVARAFRTHFGGLPATFWIVWSGVLVSRMGTMVLPFLALFLTAKGMSITTAGLVVTVVGAGATCSQLVGGALADLWGRRTTFVVGPFAAAGFLLLLGYVESLPMILLAAFLSGLALQLYQPASAAVIADVVPPAHRPRAYGLMYWAVNVGFSVASVLGGLLARQGFLWLFWVDSLTCLVFGLVIWRLMPRDTTPPAPSAGSYREVLRDGVMVAYVLLLLLHASVQFQMSSTLPLAMGLSGLSPTDFGLAIAVNGVLVVIVQPLLVNRLSRYDRSKVLSVGILLMGTGFGATVLASTLLSYALTVVVWTAGEIVIAAVVQTIVADLAPAHLRGRYNGLFGAAYALAAVVAPGAGTLLLAHAGARVLWTTCFVVCLAVAVGQWVLGPSIRRRQAAEE